MRTGRDQFINELLSRRIELALALATMPGHKDATLWATDRQRALATVNRQLEQLGAFASAAEQN